MNIFNSSPTLDHRMRRTLGECAENEIDLDSYFHHKTLFGDESDFWLNG